MQASGPRSVSLADSDCIRWPSRFGRCHGLSARRFTGSSCEVRWRCTRTQPSFSHCSTSTSRKDHKVSASTSPRAYFALILCAVLLSAACTYRIRLMQPTTDRFVSLPVLLFLHVLWTVHTVHMALETDTVKAIGPGRY